MLLSQPQTSPMIEVGGLRFDIFNQILLSIFRGETLPGSRLKVQHLAAYYGVSSTPVREALVELAGLGVVEMIPNKGAVVASFGEKEIREIYLIRRLLEVESARQACDCPDLRSIEQLLERTTQLQSAPHTPQWAKECVELDKQTHSAISDAAGVARLKSELRRYDLLVHMVRNLLNDEEPYLDQIASEHRMFLEAIVRRDKEAAAAAMATHIEATCNRTIEGIFTRPILEASAAVAD